MKKVESFAIGWMEFNNKNQLVGKYKEFKTQEEMRKFAIQLTEREGFIRLLHKMGYSTNMAV